MLSPKNNIVTKVLWRAVDNPIGIVVSATLLESRLDDEHDEKRESSDLKRRACEQNGVNNNDFNQSKCRKLLSCHYDTCC